MALIGILIGIASSRDASGQVLTDATSVVSVTCAAGPLQQETAGGPFPVAELGCDSVRVTPTGDTAQAVSMAATAFGASPQAFTRASVTGLAFLAAEAGGSALVTYLFRVVENQTPPSQVTSIPVRAAARGECLGNCDARVDITGCNLTGTPSFRANSSNPAFDTSESLELCLGSGYSVTVSAGCVAQASTSFLLNDECQGTADPTISFDQAAFDAMMGADTFPLVDFFALEFSENLITPVPALGVAGTIVLSLAVVGLAWSRSPSA